MGLYSQLEGGAAPSEQTFLPEEELWEHLLRCVIVRIAQSVKSYGILFLDL